MAAVAARHLEVSHRDGLVRIEVAETRPGLTNTARVQAPVAFWLTMTPADARRVAAALNRACDALATHADAADV